MRILRKPLSILLILAIALSLFTFIPFGAANAVQYVSRYWDDTNQKVAAENKTCTYYTTITSRSSLTLERGWYVVNGNATINDRVTVSGDVHLILLKGTLTCKQGIRLKKGNSLSVYPGKNSSGKLVANQSDEDEEATIGGNEGEDCGAFVFHGGTLEASNKKRYGAACIGGGGEGGNCGKLIFYGGKVTVDRNFTTPEWYRSHGAGIGDGYEGNSANSNCCINIYGGNISVDNHRISCAAAIGGAEESKSCPINIYGGKVVAKAYNGAGIGSGQYGTSNTITIRNATIEATSNYGAGVGSGEESDADTIIIENSNVTAESTQNNPGDAEVGSEGAGIGGGNCGKSTDIRIRNSQIFAISSRYGAGIGGGDEREGGDISIEDSIVYAYSAKGGAGIGGGCEKGCNSIDIKGSFIVAETDSSMNDKDKEFIQMGADIFSKIFATHNNMPGSGNNQEWYQMGYMTAALVTMMIQGTETGAAIGGGDEGSVNSINIEDSYVYARSAKCAAGIGGGDEGGFGTINIKNSTVKATSGDYGAAIGSGDEAKKCGAINITDSTIMADAGTDAAGIGTGNETDETATINIRNSSVESHGGRYGAGIGGGDAVSGGSITLENCPHIVADSKTDAAGIGGGESGSGGAITIKNCSDVKATGGGYAAGIGGGDHAGGGRIEISGSTVKAYGGTDAAGIGGGEDGNGGHIEISDYSNVYAQGKEYGAGIGGGEDAHGLYCSIDSTSTVEAVAGGDGWGISIGYGDYAWLASHNTGTLSLSPTSLVKAGSNAGSTENYSGSSRFNAIWDHKYAKIYPCDHSDISWRYNLNSSSASLYHYKHCTVCGSDIGREEHVWGSDNVCTKCHANATMCTYTFVERDDSQEIPQTISAPQYSYFIAPECHNAPAGYEFVCWRTDRGDFAEPGDAIYAWYQNSRVTAIYMPVETTSYIDRNGEEKTVLARRIRITDNEYDMYLPEGWYVVDRDIRLSGILHYKGNVKLILADSKTFSFDQYIGNGDNYCLSNAEGGYNPARFEIYGQSRQTGTIDFGIRKAAFYELDIYGGNVLFNKPDDIESYDTEIYGKLDCYHDCTLYKGTLKGGYIECRDLIINGGNADLLFDIARNSTQLGWTELTDSIRIEEFYNRNSVSVNEYQELTDGVNRYAEALTSDQVIAVRGKTLTPFVHDYNEPVWEWTNHYRDANAVFRCKDCDRQWTVRAKVSVSDFQNTRESHAVCEFFGQTYEAFHTGNIYWNITVVQPEHGTITASKTQAKSNDDVELDVAPDEGWILDTWIVTPEDETMDVETEYWHFRMPESNVTVTARFAEIVDRQEPYIDEDGAYIPGIVRHCIVDGEPYAINEDGTIGSQLDSVEFCYFDFTLLWNSVYRIDAYTGSTKDLTTLMIPKTYKGKPVTILGKGEHQPLFTPTEDSLTLVLTENTSTVSPYAFYDMNVTVVKGDTTELNEIGECAFASSDDEGDNPLDIDLYYPYVILNDRFIFKNRTVTIHTQHGKAEFNHSHNAKSVTYDFTDVHTYGNPVWTWSENCTDASASFTCTDTRCGNVLTLDAALLGEISGDKYIVTATVEMDGETYTDTRELPVEKAPHQIEYIDEDGIVKSALAYPMTGDETSLSGGWYYVDGRVRLSSDVTLSDSVKLILCDGSDLVTGIHYFGMENTMSGTDLTIYRAPGENIGVLDGWGVNAGTLNVIGGQINIDYNLCGDIINIKGGVLNSEWINAQTEMNLLSGSVSLAGDSYWILSCDGDINIFGGSLHIEPQVGGGVYCRGDLTICGGDVDVLGRISSNADDTFVWIAGGNVSVSGSLSGDDVVIIGGNVAIDGELYSYHDITLGWTDLSDSIYADSYGGADHIFVVEDQTLTDGTDTYSGTYERSQRELFAKKTLTPYYAAYVDRVEPYIDESGAYHLGEVEHYVLAGRNYAVNADGSMGEELSDLSLSYFDFRDNGSAWQIDRYTGPTEDMTVLEIPKTYDGKPITILGNSRNVPLIDYADKVKGQFELKLTENIVEIKPYAFYTLWVTEVSGNTSNLSKIDAFAFSWANSSGGYTLDMYLDHEGTVNVYSYCFNHMNVTLHMKHTTTLSADNTFAGSITYDFTDAHPYGAPAWEWGDDYSSATAVFTCTDDRCKHKESVEAAVTETAERSKTTYTAAADFNGETYTDTQIAEKTACVITIADTEHGSVSVDPNPAYEGEEVTLNIEPETGYKLQALTVKTSGNKDIEVSDSKFTMPGSGVTVTAVFEQKVYDITYTPAEKGWVEGAYSANYGEEITLTPWPFGGYELDALTVTDADENIIPLENDKFTMPDSDVTVTATFKKSDFTITYGPYEHGTITGAITAQVGDEVPITITPEEGYAVTNVYAETEEWEDPANIIDGVLYMQDDNVIVYATFVPIIPAKEPWIDENGEYHLGNVAYCEMDDFYFEVNGDRVGDPLDSVDVSYFDFTDNGDSYQINYYMGPTEDLTELVIPKTFNGKPITVLGTDNQSAFIANSDPKPRFTLVLNENITEIKPYAFYTMYVKKVKGDTSNLSMLGNYAFSWANSPGGYTLDIKLDYIGVITTSKGTFNHMNVTAHMSHSTSFSTSTSWAQSVTYHFTDAHTYGSPVWSWSEDKTEATATFTCSDARCKHQESVNAAVTREVRDGKNVRVATVSFNGETYTDVKDASYFGRHSITLDGDIGVNFYLNLTPAEKSTAVVNFSYTVDGNEWKSSVSLKDAEKTEYGYKATCYVCAPEMTDTITAVLSIDREEVETDHYSVKTYADVILSYAYRTEFLKTKTVEEYDRLAALVSTMLNYGAATQVQFADEHPNTVYANDGVDYDLVPLTEEELSAINMPKPDKDAINARLTGTGLTYYGYTMLLHSKTSLRFYFLKDSADTDFSGVHLTAGGVTYNAQNYNDYFAYVEVESIPAYELNNACTLSVNGTELGTYSALTYVKDVLENSPEDMTLCNTVTAMYRYHKAAVAWFDYVNSRNH